MLKLTPSLRKNAEIWAPEYPLDFRKKETKEYLKTHRLTQQEYIKKVRQEIKDNKSLIMEVYKKDINREAQTRFREKNAVKRFLGSITIDLEITVEDLKTKRERKFIQTHTKQIDLTTSKKNLQVEILNKVQEEVNDKMDTGKYKNVVGKVIDEKIDIHKVPKTQSLSNIRMRDSYAGLIDGYDLQEWDTKTGKCVFDYIIHRYGKIDGFKKICTYENLELLMSENGELNLLEEGLCVYHIKTFCKRFEIPMFAIDDDEKTFDKYITDKPNKKAPAMIFRISNNHFYPISNNNKKQSIIQTARILETVSSDLYIRDVVKPNQEEVIDVCNTEFVDNVYHKLAEVIKQKGITPTQIKMKSNQLISFKIKDTLYVLNEDIEVIKELCDNMNIKFTGQGLGTLCLKMWEESTGLDKVPKSTHTPFVLRTLEEAKKDRSHNGFINSIQNMDDCVAWDINSCYASIMYNPTEKWIKLDFNDVWEDYDGDLKLGLYYLETNDITLFKKNNIYSTAIIKKAIVEGIKFTIKKQLIPSNTENKTLFKKFIETVVHYSKDNKLLWKLPLNIFSGTLGQSKLEGVKCHINKDINQIFNWFDTHHQLNKGVFIQKIPETDRYIYGFNKKYHLNETNIPMYIQVLDQSNIKLYDMAKTMGGEIVARKTDLVVCRNMTNTTYKNNTTKWGQYKLSKIPSLNQLEGVRDFNGDLNDKEWTDYKFNDSDMYEDIYNVLETQGGLLLQADAGKGKTYVANMISSKLGKKVKKLAPTNKASLNLKGSTIHSFLKMTEHGCIQPVLLKIIKSTYTHIIIDEISMITKDLWKILCLLKAECSDVKFLLLGDDKQCPPVENEGVEDYFNHPAVKYLCNYNRNILTVLKRYDNKLNEVLKDVDNLNMSMFGDMETEKNLCYLNTTRKHINKLWNDKLKTNNCLLIEKDENDEYTQDMYIYNGLPVIARKTIKGIFVNSEAFKVDKYDDKFIYIYNERPNDDGEAERYNINVDITDFRKSFSLNYCCTTHKAQGETITENYTIYDWNVMSTKIKYTALSRAKCLEQVCFKSIHIPKEENTFVENIQKKIKGHIEYDRLKGYKNNIDVEDIKKLYDIQNGECIKCGCHMKRFNYTKGDGEQFSIDRVNSKQGHLKGNIQLMCLCCNRAKQNRF